MPYLDPYVTYVLAFIARKTFLCNIYFYSRTVIFGFRLRLELVLNLSPYLHHGLATVGNFRRVAAWHVKEKLYSARYIPLRGTIGVKFSENVFVSFVFLIVRTFKKNI